MRILVIEDNDDVREGVVEILALEGHDVRDAENGRLALAIARAWRPDLVISDLMMPELDGYATLEALRAESGSAALPFVCLTARGQPSDRQKAADLGADVYLTKPFTPEDLLAGMATALAKARADRCAPETRHEDASAAAGRRR